MREKENDSEIKGNVRERQRGEERMTEWDPTTQVEVEAEALVLY